MIPGSRVWIVGPTMDLAEKEFRVVWELTVEQGHIPVKRKSEREQWIQFANGSFIECRSEENPKQLIGDGVDLCLLVEAARLKPTTWTAALKPTLLDRQGRAIFSSTPRGYNWFEEFFRRGQPEMRNEFPDWKSWQIPSSANPLIDPKDIEDARKELPDAIFRQEWLAEFTTFSGKVFDEFNINVHIRAHAYDPYLKTALWIDPGVTNPYSVLLVQMTPDETVRVLDEIYVQGKISDQVIKMAEAKWPHALLVGGNPRPDLDVVIDEAAAESMATWRHKGYRAIGGKPGIAQGIEVIHRMLRDPFRTIEADEDNPLGIVPRLTVNPICYNTIREFGAYHYPDESNRRSDTNSGEVPVDKDNHSIAAIRYGLYVAYPELFNQRDESGEDEYVYVSTDELGPAVTRMRMESSDSGPEIRDPIFESGVDRNFALSEY